MPKSIICIEAAENQIQKALKEATRNKITGKDFTPFLLKYITDHTTGEGLEVNIALRNNDAKVGAAQAVAYSKYPY